MANLFNTLLLVATTPGVIGRDLYWVGGSASWDGTAGSKWALTSGGSGGQAIPTSIDNVHIDGNSGAVTVTIATVTANCNNLDFTGFTGTWAGSPGIKIFGNLILASGMTRTYTGPITFSATSSGKIITSNGKSLNNITFNGIGGAWQFQDTFTTATITIGSGSIDFNGQTATISGMTANSSATCSLTLGAANITCSSNWNVSGSGLTYSGASATITMTGQGLITSGSFTYGTINFTNTTSSLITSSAAVGILNVGAGQLTIGTLSRTNSSGYVVLGLSNNITITTSLTLTGNNSTTQRLFVYGFGNTSWLTPATITCNGSITLTNVDFWQITAAGSATWSGTSIGNCGGNTGITFTGAVTRYLVASSGSNDFMASIWSTSSGGSTGASQPLPQDTVVIDSNSFPAASTLAFAAPYRVGVLDFTNVTNSPTLSATNSFVAFGNIILKSTMTITSSFSFMTATSQSFTGAGINLNVNINITAAGTVTLADALNQTNTSRNVTLNSGTLNDGGFNHNMGAFVGNFATFTRTITKTGNWTVVGGFNLTSAGLTVTDSGSTKFNSTTGSIGISGVSGLGSFEFAANRTFGLSPTIITTNNNLKIDAAITVTFTGGGLLSIASNNTLGTTGNLATFQSNNTTNYSITSTSGTAINTDYISISRCTFTGATWHAGANSTDGGNNSGITFP